MQTKYSSTATVGDADDAGLRMSEKMDDEGIVVSERMEEVMMMCGRGHFMYDQISNFGIALYVLGLLDADHIMALDEIESEAAGSVLLKYFNEIGENDLPLDYSIRHSKDRYLLVVGDPRFPLHFAVLADTRSRCPFFSKLRYFGCGFDSFQELMSDFLGEDGLGAKDVRYFKLKRRGAAPASLPPNIYIVRDDGGYRIV